MKRYPPINRNRHGTDIFLCYLDYTSSKAEIVMHYLADLCRDEYKSMCLIVDNATRAQVRKMESAQWAAHIYVRPLDMNDVADDLIELADAHDEFRRKKTLLVVDATTGKNAVSQAREFNEVAELTGIILTKLDGTAKGGIVVTIADELDLPVKYIGLGEGMDDLKPFDPQEFAESIFEG